VYLRENERERRKKYDEFLLNKRQGLKKPIVKVADLINFVNFRKILNII